MIKETIANWSNHKCSTFGAALAYYSIFAFGPLMLIATVIAGFAFGPDPAKQTQPVPAPGELSAQLPPLLQDA